MDITITNLSNEIITPLLVKNKLKPTSTLILYKSGVISRFNINHEPESLKNGWIVTFIVDDLTQFTFFGNVNSGKNYAHCSIDIKKLSGKPLGRISIKQIKSLLVARQLREQSKSNYSGVSNCNNYWFIAKTEV